MYLKDFIHFRDRNIIVNSDELEFFLEMIFQHREKAGTETV